MNWDDTRVLLALSRNGTLRAAARALRVDQATVGRRLAALEQALGTTLFLRTSKGYRLTRSGEVALEAAQAMEQAALALERQVQGQDERLQGLVRIACTETVAMDLMIPVMARLARRHPGLQVRLDASTRIVSLSQRETDIAIRNVKPDNPDLIARRLITWPVGLFASEGYLQRQGMPEPGTRFAGHQIVMYQPYLERPGGGTLVGESIDNGQLVAAVNSSLLVRRCVVLGMGLGELPVIPAEQAGLIRLWPERTAQPGYDLWLVTHGDLRHSARVRAVIDEITSAFENGAALAADL
ncbi:LysR family transcriptional regulator [Pseudomonas sp. RIT-PI-S]|uniref:LysR family transcriptional regulator n=1 Tax=Pseudomonas sp. RIT-PI-S TaxID=3035295 RepID=UPI0021D89DF7|nr:LysR family transcriptional regulator [Pseudomonas sp. RIT-PI-S]